MLMAKSALPVTTTFEIPGFRTVACLGVVRGIVVRSPTLIQGFLGGLKTMIGGRIGAYTAMCEQTRQQAEAASAEMAAIRRGAATNTAAHSRF